MIERVLRRKAHKSVAIARPQLGLLVEQMRFLAQLDHLTEVKLLMLELCQIVDTTSILGCDVVDLREVLLLDDGVVDVRHHLGCVAMSVVTLLFRHDSLVEFARLVVFADFALVVEVALARDNVVRDLVRCFRGIRTELVCEAVGCVLLVACMVCIDAHLAIKVE